LGVYEQNAGEQSQKIMKMREMHIPIVEFRFTDHSVPINPWSSVLAFDHKLPSREQQPVH
jgi:hypothetical protein